MGLPKGRTNNPDGRPPGSQNKINAELRDKVKQLVEDNYSQIIEDISVLEPQSTELTGNLDGLESKDIDAIVNRLIDGKAQQS